MKNKCLLIFGCFVLILASCKKRHKQFDKLIFHTSECYLECPVYHLELNGDRKMRLFAQRVYKDARPDNSDTGHFTGILADTMFEKLSTILDTMGIDTLNFGRTVCCDGPIYTVIGYLGGKRIYLHSMSPPAKAYPLLGALLQICAKSQWRRVMSPFKIEGTERSGAGIGNIKFPPPDTGH